MEKNRLGEIAGVFFKLGLFAFGGPAAHISMMEQEIIEKRKWMSKEHFLDLIGATNLIPGPNSTEMTMHCGHERGGKLGLFVAGLSFIIPAVITTGILAWLYVEYGSLPNVEPFVQGIKPAVLAVIAAAILKLGKKAVKNTQLGVIGVIVILLSIITSINEVFILLGVGLLGAIMFYTLNKDQFKKSFSPLFPFLLSSKTTTGMLAVSTGAASTLKIFLIFLKVGAVLYGSGYVLFAYLDGELVGTGLLTRQELLDAIAVGQFTPGPVLSTSTFIGYQLNGVWGALAATTGIFLPSFLFVLILNPLIPKLRKSKFLSYFLDSVNVAALGVMVAVLILMTKESVTDWRALVIVAISIIFTFSKVKLNAMWIILIGAILGYALSFIG